MKPNLFARRASFRQEYRIGCWKLSLLALSLSYFPALLLGGTSLWLARLPARGCNPSPVFEYPQKRGPLKSFITRPPMKESSCNGTEEVGEDRQVSHDNAMQGRRKKRNLEEERKAPRTHISYTHFSFFHLSMKFSPEFHLWLVSLMR